MLYQLPQNKIASKNNNRDRCLPGLVLSWLPLPILLLLYYNNMDFCRMLTPSIVRRLWRRPKICLRTEAP